MVGRCWPTTAVPSCHRVEVKVDLSVHMSAACACGVNRLSGVRERFRSLDFELTKLIEQATQQTCWSFRATSSAGGNSVLLFETFCLSWAKFGSQPGLRRDCVQDQSATDSPQRGKCSCSLLGFRIFGLQRSVRVWMWLSKCAKDPKCK